MTKHAKKSDHLQLVDLPKTMPVEIPLPLLGAFANIENSFFDLCIDAAGSCCGTEQRALREQRQQLGPIWTSASEAGSRRFESCLGHHSPIAPNITTPEGAVLAIFAAGLLAEDLRHRGDRPGRDDQRPVQDRGDFL